MQLELYQLAGLALGYLLLLFAVGRCVDIGLVPPRLAQHPAVFVLSLGVFTGSLAYHGMGELAARHGFGFLGFYLGASVFFLAAPALLEPLHRLCRDHQLVSLADLLTLRFPSPWVGKTVCALLVAAILPLIALQIQATADAVSQFTVTASGTASAGHGDGVIGLGFCVALALLAMSFGTGQQPGHIRHAGLMAAMAVESLLKLVAFLILGAVVLWQVFGGPVGLDQWLAAKPEQQAALVDDHYAGRGLLLLTFAGVVCMPHMFHMLLAAQPGTSAVSTASWGFPLYLLLFSLPVLPITWAVIASGGEPGSSGYYTVAATSLVHSPALSTVVFLGGLAAGSGIIIVSALALSSMVVNHLLLPGLPPRKSHYYRWLPSARRVLILALLLAGYGCYRLGDRHGQLSTLGIVSMGTVLQLFPGVLAVFLFPGINYKGFLAGLAGGVLTWALGLAQWQSGMPDWPVNAAIITWLQAGWAETMVAGLLLNLLLAIVVSRMTATGPAERRAAMLCAVDHVARPRRRRPGFHSVPELRELFSRVVGAHMAAEHTQRALDELGYESSEIRPIALRRLRDRVEANLSGQLGLSAARLIMERVSPGDQGDSAIAEDIELVEGSLDQYRQELTGIAADLDNLRRQHLQTLMSLPIGLCSLAPDGEVVMWNDSMVNLTGLTAARVLGSLVDNLQAPWGALLQEFAGGPLERRHKVPVQVAGRMRWLSMYKSHQTGTPAVTQNRLVVLEDITEIHLLEQELIHSERLASVGRLAAGVAHEVGNPLTGITCLAQNIRDESDEETTREAAIEIITQAERISGIVKLLVSFSHGGHHDQESRVGPVALIDCVAEAIKLVSLDRDAKPVAFDNRCDSRCVSGDFQQLLQVFVNLLNNARDASQPGETISVTSRLVGDLVEIDVADTGCGIPREQLERIFEPFFTTKPPGEGTGLGLALVFNILSNHDGGIRVESPDSRTGRGSRFTVVLRECQRREAPAAGESGTDSHWQSG